MSDAILRAAKTHRATGLLAQIVRTQQVNQALGTNLAPWELEQVPEEWLQAVEMWAVDYPRAVEWQRQIDASLARLRGQKVQ